MLLAGYTIPVVAAVGPLYWTAIARIIGSFWRGSGFLSLLGSSFLLVCVSPVLAMLLFHMIARTTTTVLHQQFKAGALVTDQGAFPFVFCFWRPISGVCCRTPEAIDRLLFSNRQPNWHRCEYESCHPASGTAWIGRCRCLLGRASAGESQPWLIPVTVGE